MELSIGISDFAQIRQGNFYYVDKTGYLENLIEIGRRYFLSRPRRFGKSLTISTLESMFAGQKDLFKGLAAEKFVERYFSKPFPVISFSMPKLRKKTPEFLEALLHGQITRLAKYFNIEIEDKILEIRFAALIEGIYNKYGHLVVLIDEYDRPILDCIENQAIAMDIRNTLQSFYTVLKDLDKYIYFLMLTGISKFSKTGVFSSLNNLLDISMTENFGNIVGYSQEELETVFFEKINITCKKIGLSYDNVLDELKKYYDGFCFDGKNKVYNPFSVMQCLFNNKFSNYWYDSGSSSFIANYMKINHIDDPETYDHIEVPDNFMQAHEIEDSSPESFLYQGGYLTIEKICENSIILKYPNYEIKHSINNMYLYSIYKIKTYNMLAKNIWMHLNNGRIEGVVDIYNSALSSIPYDDFPNRDEYWYRSLFVMLLRGAGVVAQAEIHTNHGRSDLLILLTKYIFILEFKCAKKSSDINNVRLLGKKQIEEKNYAEGYKFDSRKLVAKVLVVDLEKRSITL